MERMGEARKEIHCLPRIAESMKGTNSLHMYKNLNKEDSIMDRQKKF